MAKIFPIQRSFAAGEYSPLMYSRADTEGWNNAVSIMENYVPDPHGPAVPRWGSEFVKTYTAADGGRVFGFQISQTESYIVVVVNGRIYINEEDGTAITDFAVPWSSSTYDDIQIAMPPDLDVMYFVHPNNDIYKLTYTNPTTWAFAAVAFTGKPSSWTGSNWPSTITFFQGRMWVGGTPGEPAQWWASKSASYEDFTTGSLADDAMTETLAQRGKIEWMVGGRDMTIGTENGEHIVSSEGGVIIPGDINIRQESAHGSNNTQPVAVGHEILLITPDSRKIRNFDYEWTKSGYVSKDFSFTAEHITSDGVKSAALSKYPYSIVWLADSDVFVSMAFEQGNNIIGWSKHPTQGTIIDLAETSENGVSVIWLLVNRKDPGNDDSVDTYHLERMKVDDDLHFMDCWKKTDLGTPGDTVTGYDHLEGKELVVTVDGAQHPNVTVSGGGFTLNEDATIVVAGLGYTQKIVTLPADFGAPGGSSAGWNKQYNKIYARLLTSALPKINGVRPPVRTPDTPMDTPEPLVSTDVQVADLGWSKRGLITIEQDLPFPTTVVGIFGEANIKND